MTGSLRGLKVLDFSTLLPGPMATLFLAEAGAEVIKIERPETGEEMRYYPPTWGDSSVNFSLLNRGKKSVTVDLKNQSEREKLIPLIEQADIFVEQFRPGVMARLGLDYESIAKINPKISLLKTFLNNKRALINPFRNLLIKYFLNKLE